MRRIITAFAGVLGCVGAAHGHGGPVPFALWANGFTATESTCQRIVGHAAAQCANRTWTARQACHQAGLQGEVCDAQQTDGAIQSARVRALNLIDSYCDDRTAANLGFLGVFEIQGDLQAFWTGYDVALVSAVYGPVSNGTAAAIDESTRHCIEAGADAATRMAAFAIAAKRRALERIATHAPPPSVKLDLVRRADARIQRARDALTVRIAVQCPDAKFTAIYGRDTAAFLDGVAARADCLAGAVYVQNAISCPTPVCGNGIQEPGETCPDGKY